MSLVHAVYNRVLRPHLPAKIAVHNGVAVRSCRLLDRTDENPGYEAELVRAVRRAVTDGDSVALVGAGLGVSTVWAARSGAEEVTAYEAGEETVAKARDTVRFNEVEDVVSVRQAVVGPGIDVWGPEGDAEHVTPDSIPAADVLVLDCEGAEASILDALEEPLPGEVVVETHAQYGSPASAVAELLDETGYRIVSNRAVTQTATDGVRLLRAQKVESCQECTFTGYTTPPPNLEPCFEGATPGVSVAETGLQNGQEVQDYR